MSHEISNEYLLKVGLEAAEKASAIAIEQRTNQSVSVSFKGIRDIVTSADIACEKAIVETIKREFSDHLILAEETAQTYPPERYGDGYVWIIDPIDGTTNYAHGHYQVGISIACALNGEVVAAIVNAPFLRETFTATKNGGAFLNDTRIKCRSVSKLNEALLSTGFPYDRINSDKLASRIGRLLPICRDIRRLGAASLDCCWVACGRLDAYFEESIKTWDGAAGCLIAREAGAVIGHYAYDHDSQRNTWRYPGDLFMDNLIVSSPDIFEELKTSLDLS